MTAKQQSTLIAHGALIFLLGMAAGFPFTFEIVGKIEVWPIPGSITVDMPGDVRGWRMAHLEGILNGVLLICVAAVGERLRLTARQAGWVTGGLLVCAWGNILASWLGPLVGGRGLSFTGLSANSIVYLLFLAAVVGVLAAMTVVFVAARRAARLPESG